eukprot:838370-Amphidinium_carterae.3
MQFDICYLKADGHRIMPGDATCQPWATTFCGVDEATQTPMAIALEQKGGASTDYIVQSTYQLRRLYGVKYKGDLMSFGETGLFRHSFSASGRGPKGKKFSKGDVRIEMGIIVGRTEDSNETAKRLPAGSRHDYELLERMTGTPWDRQREHLKGGKQANSIREGEIPSGAAAFGDDAMAMTPRLMESAPAESLGRPGSERMDQRLAR